MATPSNRVPVRIARGTKAALDAGLADLREGEVCYATDENALYVVEGGVLISTTVDLTGIEIVNDTTPQLGGNLHVNSFQIISTAAGNIQIAPDTTGVLEVMGNTGNDAAIQLNCEANTHGIKLKSPPHSAAASYTLVFPNDTGSNGQALTTDGTGVMSWTTPSTVGSINDLTDVDTTTAAPTDGQALIWDNANSEWVPGSVAADLGTSSIDALQDVDTTTAAPTTNQVLAWDGTNWVPADQSGGGGGGELGGLDDVTIAGELPLLYYAEGDESTTGEYRSYYVNSDNLGVLLNVTDANGESVTSIIPPGFVYGVTATPGVIKVADSPDGPFTDYTFTGITTGASSYRVYGTSGSGLGFISGAKYFRLDTTPADPVADGSLLVYNSTSQEWENGSGSIDTLSDVDTSTTLPTDGQVLTWVDANSQWEPATPSASGVESVNGETGAVVLDVEGLDNVRSLFTGLSLPTRDTSICNNGDNDTWNANASNFFYTAKGGATEALMNQLQIGDSITFSWSDGGSETKTVTTVNSDACTSANYINTDTDLALEPTTGGVILTSSRWGSGAATDGQVLTWVDANSQWEPANPSAALTRTALGIGEYVDDAAAGTGGVASGAMYYNTTSSDYRLKS